MTIEKQICTLQQAKKLKELGVEQNSIYCFRQSMYKIPFDITDGDWRIKLKCYTDEEEILSAFTVAELGVMLPLKLRINKHDYTFRINRYKSSCWEIKYRTKSATKCIILCQISSYHEAEARAAMLIYLLESSLITAEEVNKSLNA